MTNYCLGTQVILFKWFMRTKQFFGTTIENKDFLNGFSSKPHADQVFKLLNIDLITIVSTSNNFVDTFCRSAKTYTQKYKHSYYLNVCCGLYWLFIEIFPNYFWRFFFLLCCYNYDNLKTNQITLKLVLIVLTIPTARTNLNHSACVQPDIIIFMRYWINLLSMKVKKILI